MIEWNSVTPAKPESQVQVQTDCRVRGQPVQQDPIPPVGDPRPHGGDESGGQAAAPVVRIGAASVTSTSWNPVPTSADAHVAGGTTSVPEAAKLAPDSTNAASDHTWMSGRSDPGARAGRAAGSRREAAGWPSIHGIERYDSVGEFNRWRSGGATERAGRTSGSTGRRRIRATASSGQPKAVRCGSAVRCLTTRDRQSYGTETAQPGTVRFRQWSLSGGRRAGVCYPASRPLSLELMACLPGRAGCQFDWHD